MAHRISMQQPKENIVNKDVVFIIKKNGKKLGELRISKGALEWKPRNSTYTNYMTWSDFSGIMENGGEGAFEAYPIDGNRTIVRSTIEISTGLPSQMVFELNSSFQCQYHIIRVSPFRHDVVVR